MCGIAGIVSFKEKPDSRILRKMLASIQHRGPDSSGIYTATQLIFGANRLSIIDLVTGNQPIGNEDGSVTVVFNGEIYNFQELKVELLRKKHIFSTHTDTEVLVHLYEEYGEMFPAKLNGMFAAAIWDSKKKQLLLVRDQVGIKPLYYYHQNGLLVFGSEPKVLLAHPQVRRTIDSSAVTLYATLGYIGGKNSIFQEIKKLPPGHTLVYTTKGIKISPYWKIKLQKPPHFTLDELLADAVKQQLIADVPVGVFLSGGIDSSLITYYVTQAQKQKIKTFSIGFKEPSFDESNYAKTAARILGTQHYHETFTAADIISLFPKISALLDEPLGDASLFPTYKVSHLARKHVKVALCGDGGDELFAGYPTYQAHLLAEKIKYIPQSVTDPFNWLLQRFPNQTHNFPFPEQLRIFLSARHLSPVKRHKAWMQLLFANAQSLLRPEYAHAVGETTAHQKSAEKLDVVTQMQIVDIETYLRDDLLVKSDRASMYNSLELRVPFLDTRIIEYAISLPREKLVDFLETKKILRRLLLNKFPAAFVKRKKKGFGIPIAHWFRYDLKDWLAVQIENPELYNYFDEALLKQAYTGHIQGRKNNARQLWLASIFGGWLKAWVQKT